MSQSLVKEAESIGLLILPLAAQFAKDFYSSVQVRQHAEERADA